MKTSKITKMNLSEFSSEVLGFESKSADSEGQVQVKDSGCDAMASALELSDKCLSTNETKEIGVNNSGENLI
jgi:hypothetical protein